MGVVAWVAHALIPDLPWAAAFVLGAIVSPTNPLAAATIMRRLGVPRRLVSAAEGEGLFNDATALVAYRVAVAAVVAGTFSLAEAGLRFVLGAAGGVAIGLVVGWLVAEIRQRTTDTQLSVTISLLTGYAAFVPADVVGASGVLAAVTAGLYMGIRAPRILPVGARLQGGFIWDIVDFLGNAILFLLVGLQLRAVVEGLSGYSTSTLWRLCPGGDGGGRGDPAGLVLHGSVPGLGDRPPTGPAGPAGRRARAVPGGLERDAWRGDAGGAAHDRGRWAVPGSEPDRLSHLHGHLGHSGRPRAVPASPDPPPSDQPGCRRRRRGAARAAGRDQGRPGPDRRPGR
jgi:Sodium/hydrogen exchanger family